jgi:ATP-dependent DNA ligase
MSTIEFPSFKNYTDQVVHYLQPKFDGHLRKVFIDNVGRIQILTKNDKDNTAKLLKIKHIAKELFGLPWSTALFGEIHSPGILASSIPTLVNNADEKLILTVFAAPRLGGKDMSNVGLKSVMNRLSKLGVETAETTDILPGKLSEKRKKELLQIAANNKWEGWVVKESHMDGWYKLKPVKSIDAFITDVLISDSKTCFGGLRSVTLGLWSIDGSPYNLGVCGGGFKKPFRMQFMTQKQIDSERIKFIEVYPNAPIEKLEVFDLPRLDTSILIRLTMEVEYDSVTAGGKLRFPRFIRWRDDKDSKDCTVEQL